MPDIELDLSVQEQEIARLEAELNKEEHATEEQEPEPQKQEEPEPSNVEEEEPATSGEEEEKEPAKDDHAAWAKLRRERAEEKRRADKALEDYNNLLKTIASNQIAPQQKPEPVAKHPDPETDPEGYLAWKIHENDRVIAELKAKIENQQKQTEQAQTYQAAIQEFSTLVQDFSSKTEDAQNALNFLEAEMKKAIRLQNPTIPSAQIQGRVNDQILRISSDYARQGLNPVEELYAMAHEFGYKKTVAAPVKTENAPAAKPKPNLSNIDKTRQRAATGLSAGAATGKSGIGIDSIAGMTVQDFARLTPEQLRELEAQI